MALRLAPPKRKLGMVPLIMGTGVGLLLGYHGLALINNTNCLLNGGEWKGAVQFCDMTRMESDWKIYKGEGDELLRRVRGQDPP